MMRADNSPNDALEFRPLTPERWADFESLFGKRGACGGCWCMWFRVSRKEFETQKGAGNRKAMKATVDSGVVPGLLAYHEDRPVGWCSVAPRQDYPRLEGSRILKPVDDQPAWSIVCLFVAKSQRGKGVFLFRCCGLLSTTSGRTAALLSRDMPWNRGRTECRMYLLPLVWPPRTAMLVSKR